MIPESAGSLDDEKDSRLARSVKAGILPAADDEPFGAGLLGEPSRPSSTRRIPGEGRPRPETASRPDSRVPEAAPPPEPVRLGAPARAEPIVRSEPLRREDPTPVGRGPKPGEEPLRIEGGEGPEARESTSGPDHGGSARRRSPGAPSRPTNRMRRARSMEAPPDEERSVPEERPAPQPSARAPRLDDAPRSDSETDRSMPPRPAMPLLPPLPTGERLSRGRGPAPGPIHLKREAGPVVPAARHAPGGEARDRDAPADEGRRRRGRRRSRGSREGGRERGGPGFVRDERPPDEAAWRDAEADEALLGEDLSDPTGDIAATEVRAHLEIGPRARVVPPPAPAPGREARTERPDGRAGRDRPRDGARIQGRPPASAGDEERRPPRVLPSAEEDDLADAPGLEARPREELFAEDVPIDVPSWLEPVDEDAPFYARERGRPDLLPAGVGIDPGGEEAPDLEAGPDRGIAPVAQRPILQKRILINAMDSEEVRIALLENGKLEELYFERADEKKYLGNIYKGRVVNLEPGIQAAFVELGIGRNGFLHVSDVLLAYKDATAIPIDSLSVRLPDRRRLKIQEILRKGQEVLVQISKDAIGAKGPSLTTYVSVPGKYLVLMPGVNRHGVSKRILDEGERLSLRDKLSQLDPPRGMGYIVRTAGQDRPKEDLEKDFQYLMKVWEEVRTRVRDCPAPSLVYAETDLVTRALRDLLGPDVDEILIDHSGVYDSAREFLAEVMPQAARRLKPYTGAAPLFSRFGVEEEIEKIYNRRVPLPSGGHIVLEQTEALVAIDVNSGTYRDEEDLEATALKTNLEAAQEIARQLRLRDLGGVIVNDFIDMEAEPNRRAVERALRAALKRDRAKSWISRISRFDIIEMTRQRVRPSFERSNHEPCKSCRGTGVVKSARSSGIAILRQVRAALAMKRRDTCEVVAHPAVAEYLLNDRRSHLAELEAESQKRVLVRADPAFSPDQFVIRHI
ncbi:MAG TPA: Rne/Rng family ribonuclease [Planctomycetota bacterium]|nr:Rne/Rng family ribonuclease [Planctomycetota bacterium]